MCIHVFKSPNNIIHLHIYSIHKKRKIIYYIRIVDMLLHVHESVEIKLISMAGEIQHNRQGKNKHNEHLTSTS